MPIDSLICVSKRKSDVAFSILLSSKLVTIATSVFRFDVKTSKSLSQKSILLSQYLQADFIAFQKQLKIILILVW